MAIKEQSTLPFRLHGLDGTSRYRSMLLSYRFDKFPHFIRARRMLCTCFVHHKEHCTPIPALEGTNTTKSQHNLSPISNYLPILEVHPTLPLNSKTKQLESGTCSMQKYSFEYDLEDSPSYQPPQSPPLKPLPKPIRLAPNAQLQPDPARKYSFEFDMEDSPNYQLKPMTYAG